MKLPAFVLSFGFLVFLVPGANVRFLGLAGTQKEAESPEPSKPKQEWTELVYARAQPSIVTVKQYDEHGSVVSVGTGFSFQPGIIATCYHVIGEGRLVGIELPDGTEVFPESVLTADSEIDLALLSVPDTNLPPLPLAEGSQTPGMPVLAIGNPKGLRESVTSGIVSGQREIDGEALIQIAIPIEPGNSGGPLLNQAGSVLGVLTLKSSLTANLGFAIPAKRINDLDKDARWISMEKWQGFSALDTHRWSTSLGANWRMRGARFTVNCQGEVNTGRSLCLRTEAVASVGIAISTWLRFNDDNGGAGIAFGHAEDGSHYGFYLLDGKAWLAEFSGEIKSRWEPISRAGSVWFDASDWNQLAVQFDPDRVVCLLNGRPVLTNLSVKIPQPTAKAGFLKLQQAHAEFRDFSVGPLGSQPAQPASEVLKIVTNELGRREAVSAELLTLLEENAEIGRPLLLQQAQDLMARAARLRAVANEIHLKKAVRDLVQLIQRPDFDLAEAALLVAAIREPDLPVQLYLIGLYT